VLAFRPRILERLPLRQSIFRLPGQMRLQAASQTGLQSIGALQRKVAPLVYDESFLCSLLFDFNAHGTGSAGDHFFNGVDVVGVHVGGFFFGDLGQLGVS
jgi:hypothetical protein